MKNNKTSVFDIFSEISLFIMSGILSIVFLLYLGALLSISIFENIFPDADTAFYWFTQLTETGKEVTGILLAVFIFEFILIFSGKKFK